jgi:hypothetical protein
MKRFSSALIVALAAVTSCAVPVFAQSAARSASSEALQLADNAPDSYTVVKGDTLWDISGRFLKSPWRWPEVWKLNTEQIRNPHWIYPGQVVYLDRKNMTLSLTPGNSGMVKLSPQIHSTPALGPIASVPLQNIQQFLVEPLVTESENPIDAGTVIGIQENRVMAGTDETIFARNLSAPNQVAWSVFRPGKPIKDPLSNEVLGYEAIYAGQARVRTPERPPVAAAMSVGRIKHEVSVGDRLLPAVDDSNFAYVPHAAPADIQARIASIYGGLDETGVNGVVTINAGRNQGIEPGHVAALYRVLGNASYRGPDGGQKVQEIPLPDERYGLLFVFRVFSKLSYAYVLESTRPVRVGDKALAP